MYALEWRNVSALTRGLFWCLFPELWINEGNKYQNNRRHSHICVCVCAYSGRYVLKERFLNTLPIDAIGRHRTWLILAQVMAYCLTPSHYLNQRWLPISEVPEHSAESNILRSAHEFDLHHAFGCHIFKIVATSSSGQWVKSNIFIRSTNDF